MRRFQISSLSTSYPISIRNFHLTNFRMKDVMAVLLQCVLYSRATPYLLDQPTHRLKGVSDLKKTCIGEAIEGRLQMLCEAFAKDIKGCDSVCDVYIKSVHTKLQSLVP